ncbi:MAG TPA: hypothetical protein VGP20_04860 [Steroidobacteraceae bacterium]|jgi:hypothetical protein|nr:hypothetical protein [Steroidobacteraceae bacterium]
MSSRAGATLRAGAHFSLIEYATVTPIVRGVETMEKIDVIEILQAQVHEQRREPFTVETADDQSRDGRESLCADAITQTYLGKLIF